MGVLLSALLLASMPALSSRAATPQVTTTAVPATVGTAERAAQSCAAAGATFNDPRGNEEAQQRIIRMTESCIDGSPPGSVIRIATLDITFDYITDGLIAAHDRGVRVKIVLPSTQADEPDGSRLARSLGTDVSQGSFVRFCYNGCHLTGVMHAKFSLFSMSGGARQVAMSTSSNLTPWSAHNNWNDAYTTAGNTRVYAAYVRYFRSLLGPRRTFRRTYSIGDYRLWFYPTPVGTRRNQLYNILLSNIRCPRRRPTVVRVSTSLWSTTMARAARRLVALQRYGCVVRVSLQSDHTDPLIVEILRRGHVRSRFSDVDEDGQAGGSTNSHSKFITINGRYLRSDVRSVTTGSLNMSRPGSRTSDNNMIWIGGQRAHAAYVAAFDDVWEQSVGIGSASGRQATRSRPMTTREQLAAD